MNASATEFVDDDDRFFAVVAKELSVGRRDEALWTKAFALENGDGDKTKAHYIRLRVEKLKLAIKQNKTKSLVEPTTDRVPAAPTQELKQAAATTTDLRSVSDTSDRSRQRRASTGGAAVRNMSRPLRWTIAAVGAIFLMIIYGIWREVEKRTALSEIPFVSVFLRGAVVFGGIAWLWSWARNGNSGREQEVVKTDETEGAKNTEGSRENLVPLYFLVGVVGLGMLYFLSSQYRNPSPTAQPMNVSKPWEDDAGENTETTSAVQAAVDSGSGRAETVTPAEKNVDWDQLPQTEQAKVELAASEIARQHNANAEKLKDETVVSSHAEAYGRNVVFTYVLNVMRDLSDQKLKEFQSAVVDDVIPKVCQANANSPAFQNGLIYIFEYHSEYGQKLAALFITKKVCERN